MTEYLIADEIISISTEIENEREVDNKVNDLVRQVGNIFDKWYSSQYNCNSVFNNVSIVLDDAITPIIKIGVSILNDKGVYTINEKIFSDKYLSQIYVEFNNLLNEMRYEVDDIDEQKQLDKKYRQVRKDCRGRVIGGGFGLSGAVKGMATAGVMNATTGMVHSIGNTVGNIGSSMTAQSNKSLVHKKYRILLREALIKTGWNVRKQIRIALEEANIHCKYVSVSDAEQAKAIIENYEKGTIPTIHEKKMILQALKLDPTELSIYKIIWSKFGDKTGDLKKMANFFNCTLDSWIEATAKQYGNKIFSENCMEYEQAFNKISAAIKCEKEICTTLEILTNYCAKYNVSVDFIPKIKECKQLLECIDSQLRIVDGVMYGSRRIAEKVKKDIKLFYSALEGKDIYSSQIYDELISIDYITNQFRDNLEKLYMKEKVKRAPDKIHDNILNLMNVNLKKDTFAKDWVDIPTRLGVFSQKDELIRTLTGLPLDEVPLILFNRSSNGKSGVLITNTSLRVYSKGIFSNENQTYKIENITKIECTGHDEYTLNITGQNNICISLKQKNIPVEEQIALGKTINKIIMMINNLLPASRYQLYRILHSSNVCSCGTHLIDGETICPSCKRMLKRNGEFVDTKECPSCKNLIPVYVDFCHICGLQLEDISNKQVFKKPIILTKTKDDSDNKSTNHNFTTNIFETKSESNIDNHKNNPLKEFMSCPNCSNHIQMGKKFCTKCGFSILQMDAAKTDVNINNQESCPNCHNPIKPGKKFCTTCGTKL